MDKPTAIKVTINTPGWGHIQQMMESRIEQARLVAFMCTKESEVLELWRRYQVADQMFRGFLQEIEQLSEN